jgi:hypothetical protein
MCEECVPEAEEARKYLRTLPPEVLARMEGEMVAITNDFIGPLVSRTRLLREQGYTESELISLNATQLIESDLTRNGVVALAAAMINMMIREPLPVGEEVR